MKRTGEMTTDIIIIAKMVAFSALISASTGLKMFGRESTKPGK